MLRIEPRLRLGASLLLISLNWEVEERDASVESPSFNRDDPFLCVRPNSLSGIGFRERHRDRVRVEEEEVGDLGT